MVEKLNYEVIQQWRDDLLGSECPIKLNANQFVRVDNKGDIEGDAALTLCWRYLANQTADIDAIIVIYQRTAKTNCISPASVPESIVHELTGIPLEDAALLVNPAELMDSEEYVLEDLTPCDFVRVLDAYIETGHVLWTAILEESKDKKVIQ